MGVRESVWHAEQPGSELLEPAAESEPAADVDGPAWGDVLMPFLEDLILGIEGPDYSLVGADLSPEERRKKREEEFLAYQTQLRDMWSAPAGGQAGLEAASAEAAGLGGQPRELMRDVAQARMGEGEAGEGEDVIRAAVEAQRSKAAEQDDWVRAVGYEPDPTFSEPDKGILVGEIPAEKLMRIRAQANAASRLAPESGGRFASDIASRVTPQDMPGQAPGRGTLSVQSPEATGRSEELAAWAGGQPERDLGFAMTPEMSRRDPEYAATAAQNLVGLREQRGRQQQRDIQSALVDRLAGKGGTIAPEQAAHIQALGGYVPPHAIGSSKEEGVAFFDDAIQKGGTFLAGQDRMTIGMQDPMTQIQKLKH